MRRFSDARVCRVGTQFAEVGPAVWAMLMEQPPFLDRAETATAIAGSLLISISFITKYSHGAFAHFLQLMLDKQVGVCQYSVAD